MLAVAVPKRNKLQNIIVLTPKDGKRLEKLMLDTSQLVKDVGTMLEGEEAVKEGLIDEVGGMREALAKLYELIEEKNKKN